MREQDIRSSIEKLRVKPGGRATDALLAPGWHITFMENDDVESRREHPYTLRLRVARDDGSVRTQTVHLKRDQVETRGRSTWARDNSWRLRADVLEGFAAQIALSMEKTSSGDP